MMTPAEFKLRFTAALPDVPPDLKLQLGQFVCYPAEAVGRLQIGEAARAILIDSGLPRSAPPFLSFGFRDQSDLLKPLGQVSGPPDARYDRYRMIGFNGSGDMICVDEEDRGAVVYLNHDNNMEVVLMNSDVEKLAECLCVFAESKRRKDWVACRDSISRIDPRAIKDQTFWWRAINQFSRRA